MLIRVAKADDLNQMQEIATSLSKKYVTKDFPPMVEMRFLESLGEENFQKRLSGEFTYLVATEGERVLGFVGVEYAKHLYHLFVDENFQNQGIARKLWNAIVEKTLPENPHGEFTVNASLYAKPMYEKLGFTNSGDKLEKNGIVTIPMKYILPIT